MTPASHSAGRAAQNPVGIASTGFCRPCACPSQGQFRPAPAVSSPENPAHDPQGWRRPTGTEAEDAGRAPSATTAGQAPGFAGSAPGSPPHPTVHFCAAVPLHVQICSRVPLAALLFGTSRHLSAATFTMSLAASTRHFWAPVPLQS